MKRPGFPLAPLRWLAASAILLLAASMLYASTSERTIYSFKGGTTDGELPSNGLIADKAGNLYGTTVDDGSGYGIVFELSPTDTGWTESVLYAFQGGNDGAYPWTTLVVDMAGNLYGTTASGGGVANCLGSGCGTVFELSPPSTAGSPWTETELYSFNGADGANPHGAVTFDDNGNLYGTTNGGGDWGVGTVFELSPPAGSGGWTETILHAFRLSGDGAYPEDAPIFGKDGALYGSTPGGGASSAGIIYSLHLQSGIWTYRPIYSFTGGSDGGSPACALAVDEEGNLYGTTINGGAFGSGTVFEITASLGSPLTETVLYSFRGKVDGAYPTAGVTLDKAGNIYGTTSGGGSALAYEGTVFQLSPSTAGGPWSETVLHLFNDPIDGINPNSTVTLGKGGDLYSTTPYGGAHHKGTIFRIAP